MTSSQQNGLPLGEQRQTGGIAFFGAKNDNPVYTLHALYYQHFARTNPITAYCLPPKTTGGGLLL